MSSEGHPPAPDDVPLWDASDLVDELALPEDPALRGGGMSPLLSEGSVRSASPPSPPQSWETYDPGMPSTAQAGGALQPAPARIIGSVRKKSRAGLLVGAVAVVAVAGGVASMNFGYSDEQVSHHDISQEYPYGYDFDADEADEDVSQVEVETWQIADDSQAKGVVAVTATSASGTERNVGGLLVRVDADADVGFIVVPYHMVAGSSQVSVAVAGVDGRHIARMVGFDMTRDVAVLSASGVSQADPVDLSVGRPGEGEVSIAHLALADMSVEVAGSSVRSIGASATIKTDPYGDGFFARLSGLLNVEAPDAAADVGDAILNSSNVVVGMAVWKGDETSDLYAVRGSEIDTVVRYVLIGEDRGTVRVGSAGGPAAKAGLAKDDQLVKIGDVSLALKDLDAVGVEGVIRMLEPGAKVKLTWRPSGGGKDKTATVTVAENATN